MENKDMIKSMYYGQLGSFGDKIQGDEAVESKIKAILDELHSLLAESDTKKLKQLDTLYNELNALTNAEAWQSGFRAGVQLMAESFNSKK